jgi:hypothetical protein
MRAATDASTSTSSPLVIRPPRKNGVLSAIAALVPAALIAALTLRAWFGGRTSALGLVPGLVATALAVAGAAYLVLNAFRSRILVHDTGLERVSVFRRRVVGWTSVVKIAFNPHHHWFFVTASDGTRLWLPADVGRMDEFARIALRRLRPAVLDADPVVREVLDELAGEGTAGA